MSLVKRHAGYVLQKYERRLSPKVEPQPKILFQHESVETIYGILLKKEADTVAICLDPKGWVAKETLFSTLDKVFSFESTLMAYSDFLHYPSYTLGVVPTVVGKYYTPLPLVAFRASLLFSIPLEKWIKGEQWVSKESLMFQLFQKAKTHITYIPEPLCIYERSS